MSFLHRSEAAVVDSCVQEALNLTPAHVRKEPQSTNSSTSTNTSTVASEEKGLAEMLRKITSASQQKTEEDQTVNTPENSERREQDLPVSAIHSTGRQSTGVVVGAWFTAASPRQGFPEAFVHPSNQLSFRETVQCQWAQPPLVDHYLNWKVNMMTFLHFNLK